MPARTRSSAAQVSLHRQRKVCENGQRGASSRGARAPDVLDPLADQARDLGRERLERRGRVAGRRRLVTKELRARDTVPVLLPRLPHTEAPPAHNLQVVPPGVCAYSAPARPLAPSPTAPHTSLRFCKKPTRHLYHINCGPGVHVLADLQLAVAHGFVCDAPCTRGCPPTRTL